MFAVSLQIREQVWSPVTVCVGTLHFIGAGGRTQAYGEIKEGVEFVQGLSVRMSVQGVLHVLYLRLLSSQTILLQRQPTQGGGAAYTEHVSFHSCRKGISVAPPVS